jgi:SAM-dependent methyltransferase
MKTLAAPRFGIDAPTLVLGFASAGPVACVLGLLAAPAGSPLHALAPTLQSTGVSMLISAALMSLSSLVGKPWLLHRMVRALGLRGDERVLDVGCGRGMLLIEVARALPRGKVCGVDIWSTRDQSGNAREATLANVAAARMSATVAIDTGDMRQLPCADASFDAVVSSIASHNLANAADRVQAVREIARVLAPGGRVALLDFRCTAAYAQTLREAGLVHVRRSWPNLAMFPPVRVVSARRA